MFLILQTAVPDCCASFAFGGFLYVLLTIGIVEEILLENACAPRVLVTIPVVVRQCRSLIELSRRVDSLE